MDLVAYCRPAICENSKFSDVSRASGVSFAIIRLISSVSYRTYLLPVQFWCLSRVNVAQHFFGTVWPKYASYGFIKNKIRRQLLSSSPNNKIIRPLDPIPWLKPLESNGQLNISTPPSIALTIFPPSSLYHYYASNNGVIIIAIDFQSIGLPSSYYTTNLSRRGIEATTMGIRC
jgi:hypothetical protein